MGRGERGKSERGEQEAKRGWEWVTRYPNSVEYGLVIGASTACTVCAVSLLCATNREVFYGSRALRWEQLNVDVTQGCAQHGLSKGGGGGEEERIRCCSAGRRSNSQTSRVCRLTARHTQLGLDVVAIEIAVAAAVFDGVVQCSAV